MTNNHNASGSVALTQRLRGRQIDSLSITGKNALNILFSDGSNLRIKAPSGGLTIATDDDDVIAAQSAKLEKRNQARARAKIVTKKIEVPNIILPPTERETDYLDFIKEHTNRYGKPPAPYDMERRFQIPAHQVEAALLEMERKGLIARKFGQPKSIRICR